MSSLEQIEEAIARLPNDDFAKLAQWFDEQRNRRWDEQIAADSASGALDFLVRELDEDIAAGRTRPIDEKRRQP